MYYAKILIKCQDTFTIQSEFQKCSCNQYPKIIIFAVCVFQSIFALYTKFCVCQVFIFGSTGGTRTHTLLSLNQVHLPIVQLCHHKDF